MDLWKSDLNSHSTLPSVIRSCRIDDQADSLDNGGGGGSRGGNGGLESQKMESKALSTSI